MVKTTWRTRGVWLTGVLILVTIVGGWFQAGHSTSEVPVPTIRASTHLVLVDVVVTDKQGKHIDGLRAEDFVVQEKGKNQKISLDQGEAQPGWGSALPARLLRY
jgi:hypothetical protein